MAANPVKLSTKSITEQKRLLTLIIVEFCGKDLRPMEIISGEGFKNLAQHLIRVGATCGNIDVLSILPHPTTVSRHITDVKKTLNEKMFPIIQNAMVNDECSATTDMWTDDYKKNPFITMTVHFFDENFVLKKHVLFTSLFKPEGTEILEKKSGINIKNEMIKHFESLGYNREYLKKLRFVTDLGSNVVKALKEGPYTRDDCRAHRLNTIEKNTFESDDIPLIIEKIINSCKNIVRHMKQSGKSNLLPKAVVQECSTRWNTKLTMIASVTKHYQQIMDLLTDKQRTKWSFNVNLAKEIERFLTPFEEATKALEGDTYPTACKVLVYWDYLSKHLDENNFADLPMKIVVRTAKKFFDLKFEVSMDNKIACFLDPRYRFLKMLPEVERNEVYDEVKRLLQELNENDDVEPPPTKKGKFSMFEESADDFDEFERYMQTANYSEYLDTKHNKIHLVELFWRNNKDIFPKLFKLAKKRLHVPASSAPSERIFSSAGKVYNSSTTNLKPAALDDLLYIRENINLRKTDE